MPHKKLSAVSAVNHRPCPAKGFLIKFTLRVRRHEGCDSCRGLFRLGQALLDQPSCLRILLIPEFEDATEVVGVAIVRARTGP